MADKSELERDLDALYVAVRNGATPDRQAAFDVAMNELERYPLLTVARELAEASVTDGDETRLERALDAVRADLRATGLTGKVRLVRPEWNPHNAMVETWAGDQGWTGGIFPSDADDDISALVAVAEQGRQAVTESLDYQSTGRWWPVCPAHGAATTPTARDGIGVWPSTAV
jgi:hypothetical protein